MKGRLKGLARATWSWIRRDLGKQVLTYLFSLLTTLTIVCANNHSQAAKEDRAFQDQLKLDSPRMTKIFSQASYTLTSFMEYFERVRDRKIDPSRLISTPERITALDFSARYGASPMMKDSRGQLIIHEFDMLGEHIANFNREAERLENVRESMNLLNPDSAAYRRMLQNYLTTLDNLLSGCTILMDLTANIVVDIEGNYGWSMRKVYPDIYGYKLPVRFLPATGVVTTLRLKISADSLRKCGCDYLYIAHNSPKSTIEYIKE